MKMQPPLDLSGVLAQAALSKPPQPCFELHAAARFGSAPTLVAIVIKPPTSYSATPFGPMPAKPSQRQVKLNFRQQHSQHGNFDLIRVFESSPKLDCYYRD